MPGARYYRRQFRRIRQKQQSSVKPSNYRQRSKSSSRRANNRIPHNKGKNCLSADEWRVIREAVETGAPIPSNSSKDMLLGYHYALRQQAKQLAKEKIEIQKRKDSAIAASNAAHRARSDASHTNARRNHRHG
jgi:hypothetical protein